MLTLVLVQALAFAGAARATYPGGNGQLAFEAFDAQDDGSGAPYTERDAVETRSITITSCDNGQSGQSTGPLPCDFGAPSYSPNGGELVTSRQLPTDPFYGRGGHGELMLLGAGGGAPRLLPRQTADDEHPAFLPSGRTLVFDGRTAAGATPNLYEVGADGSGLRRLTADGAAAPAPCANGTIAFVHAGNVFRLSRDLRTTRRITPRGGGSPSCSPDSRRIAFTRAGELYTIGSDGQHLRRLVRGTVLAPTYSPSGTRIAYLVQRDVPPHGTEFRLRVVDLRGRRAATDTIVARSSAGGSTAEIGHSRGIAWQPSPLPLTTYRPLRGVPIHSDTRTPVTQIAFGAGDRLLATVVDNGTLDVFTIRSARGAVAAVHRRTVRMGALAIAFGLGGRLLAVSDFRGGIALASVNRSTGALHRVAGAPFPTVAVRLAFSPDGRFLAALGGDGHVELLSVNPAGDSLRRVATAPPPSGGGSSGDIAFGRGGTVLAVAESGLGVSLFAIDRTSGRLAPVANVQHPGTTDAAPLRFTAAGTLLAGALSTGETGSQVDSVASGAVRFGPVPGTPFAPLDYPVAESFSPDGRLLAATVGARGFDNPGSSGVLLASLAPGSVRVPDAPIAEGTSPYDGGVLQFDPSGRLLAVGDGGSVVLLSRHVVR